jgi:hypothetical protein
MDNRELIAAILTAGMLPTLEIPRSRAHGSRRPVTETEGEDIQRAVGHAVGLYRSVLEGLGVEPFAGLPGHDTPQPGSPRGAGQGGGGGAGLPVEG